MEGQKAKEIETELEEKKCKFQLCAASVAIDV